MILWNLILQSNYNFFTVINESVIFSNDISVIQNMLLNYNNKSLIINNPSFLNFLKSIPEKTTYFEILNIGDSNETMDYPYWFTNYDLLAKIILNLFSQPQNLTLKKIKN